MARISPAPRNFMHRSGPVLYSSTEPTKVLAVGNQQRFTEQISGLLEDHRRISLLGGAHNRTQAAERIVLLKPDVVVIEVNLDYELGGIDTAFALRSISPTTAFVLISPYSDPERLAMVPRGLGLEWSYLLSRGEIEKDDLVSAINSAAWSIPFIDSRIDRSQLGQLNQRVSKAVEDVLRIAKRSPRRAGPSSSGLGYANSADWHGKIQTFRLPEEGSEDEQEGKA